MSRMKRNHEASGTLGRAGQAVDRTGQVLQHRIASKVAAVLSSAARRLEPAEPKRGPWGKLAVGSVLTTAATAVAAVVLNRSKPQAATSAEKADADKVTPTVDTRDDQARTSTEADPDGRVPAS